MTVAQRDIGELRAVVLNDGPATQLGIASAFWLSYFPLLDTFPNVGWQRPELLRDAGRLLVDSKVSRRRLGYRTRCSLGTEFRGPA